MSWIARMISSSRSLSARAQARPRPPSSSARCASARPAFERGGERFDRAAAERRFVASCLGAQPFELRLDLVAVEQVGGRAAAVAGARGDRR